jgi:hypothetical protein
MTPLEALEAKQAITEALHRYCYAMDRIDQEMGYQVWHPDGVARYDGIFEGSARDFVDWVLEQHRTLDGTSHQVSNIVIEVAGEQATSETYVTACIRNGQNDIVARGRYQDTWSRRDGAWRIDDRHFKQDLVHIIPVGEQPRATA